MKLDEIGHWSEIKLEIIKKYAKAYSTILNKQSRLYYIYIDAFAGAGIHISKESGKFVPGSPLNALWIDPPFKHYHFIDLDRSKITLLKEQVGLRRDVDLHEGDCNEILLRDLFPSIKYEDYRRALCVLDPYGVHLKWDVMLTAGKSRTIDIFLNFPVLDMNRNVLWSRPSQVAESQLKRMNEFWGDDSWYNSAYDTSQTEMFGPPMPTKKNIKSVVKAFRKRLRDIANFKYVADPIPMRTAKRGLLYYLFFASQRPVAQKIVEDIFNRYRREGYN